ncbi:MAG: hypothetical protein KGY75_06195 [Candidatus Cloacimonetes bacterium]|nr:hypothetical protein [Candidatus Cloacimonadota bacterium]MBS3767690.1 hypothetical protein [Candidatus Cloacimonadota bacterium]
MFIGGEVKKEWLLEKISVEEAEERNMTYIEEVDKEVPFGFMLNFWLMLRSLIKDGDELWTFSNSKREWRLLAGREGLCIVRDGEIIHSMVTRMS